MIEVIQIDDSNDDDDGSSCSSDDAVVVVEQSWNDLDTTDASPSSLFDSRTASLSDTPDKRESMEEKLKIEHPPPLPREDDVSAQSTQALEDKPDDPKVPICSKTASIEPEANKEPEKASNPFAKFALGKENSTITTKPTRSLDRWIKQPPSKKPKKKEFIPMKDLSATERENVLTKWHSLLEPTHNNNDSCLETRRFQLVVAARLHARCQEGPVRKAMERLRQTIHPLNAATVATTDPHVIQDCITNLQFYSVKAQHIVQAAQEIVVKGSVPETETELQTLTGIGPVMADLLALVNTRAIHHERQQQSVTSV